MAVGEHRGAVVATAGGVVALIGTFLPWLRSGARDRSSYTIFDLVDRLGFAPSGMISWSLRVWPLVPLLVVVAVVAVWWPTSSARRRSIAASLTALLVLWMGLTSLAVNFAPNVALFRMGPGPLVTAAGAVALGVGAVLSLRESGASAAS